MVVLILHGRTIEVNTYIFLLDFSLTHLGSFCAPLKQHPYTTAACAAGVLVVTVTAGRDRTARAVATAGIEGYITYHNLS